jgi:hypothetical protein
MAQHRGLADWISAHPQSRLEAAAARKVIDAVEESGALSVELAQA